MAVERVTVPDLGDADGVEVIELLVSVGQEVAENDSLLVLESDKAAMEIPAPVAGVVKDITVSLGDKLGSGAEICTLETSGAEVSDDGAEEGVEEEAKDETKDETKGEAAEQPEQQAEPQPEQQTEQKPPAASPQGKSESTINVPDLGTEDEVEVIEVHVKEGDAISADDPLITLESDKAAMDVPAPAAGTVASVLVAVGDKLRTGASILRLESDGGEAAAPAPAAKEAPPPQAAPTPAVESAPAPTPTSVPLSPAASGQRVYAGPAVRKLARELGVNLQQVTGTGIKNRITKEDLRTFAQSGEAFSAAAPSAVGASAMQAEEIDFSQFGEVEKVQRSNIHKITAANMTRNWQSIPHVAQFIEADVTDLEAFREEVEAEAKRREIKLTYLPFLLKACAKALQEYPQFNVSLHPSGEFLYQKKYIHIGVAVATEAGLVVPVVRDVDRKTIWELASEVAELSEAARARRLTREAMQGACFTISSLGAIGGTGFIPIINAPEVAILGVARTTTKPVYIDGGFQPRRMLPLTLSYDHKAVNGVDGGLFATHLMKVLGDIRHLVL